MSEERTEQSSGEEVANETPVDAMGHTKNAAVLGVDVDIVAVLGTADLKISQILQLGRGAVVELDRFVGEPIDIRAERKLVARGEVVVVSDKLAVQITEVVGREEA
mgnify:FL=1